MDTTERDLLMLSQRLMLIPISMDGLGYRTYGYGYPYAYGAYGYYGKRSADAEPKADADPYLLYGGYGLGLLDIMDMLDTHTPMDTMERDLLMLSQRLMLIPISCTEDMALAMLDIMDMLDTHTPTDTTERDLLMLSQRLMLMP